MCAIAQNSKFEILTNCIKTDMKRILLTVLGVVAFSSVSAQDMKFGVRAGLFSSRYDGYALHRDEAAPGYDFYDYYDYYGLGNAYSNTSKVGIYVGGLVDFQLVNKFRLQPELNVQFVPDGDLGYIGLSVPVLVKYSFFDKFYAMAGPGFNYAVDGDDDQFSPSFDLGASYDLMEDFYVELRADIGVAGYLGTNINAGVGYRF